MADFKFKYNKAGYFEVMGTQAMKNILINCAQCVTSSANGALKNSSDVTAQHHKWKLGYMRDGRPATFVYTCSNAAKKAQSGTKTLEKSLTAARGGVY